MRILARVAYREVGCLPRRFGITSPPWFSMPRSVWSGHGQFESPATLPLVDLLGNVHQSLNPPSMPVGVMLRSIGAAGVSDMYMGAEEVH